MFRPYIKQKRILVAVAIINLLLVFISYKSYSFKLSDNYDLKIKTSTIMRGALDHTNKFNEELELKVLDSLDKFNSGLIGVDSIASLMTTKKGFINSKRAVTNPNFASVFIDLFSKIDLSLIDVDTPDTIAVSFTGSFPGANIALLSACKAANIYPIIISSIGSSSWGANQTKKTWLDIENYLFNKNYFDYQSLAFSLGGDNDRLDELDKNIRQLLIDKIINKNYPLIQDSTLNESILSRMEIYNSKSNNYRAYVNIGGSSASLGDTTISKMYLPGLIYGKDLAIEDAIDDEYELGHEQELVPVIAYFLEEKKIPVINIRNINNLCDWYDLPYKEEDYSKEALQLGKGNLFGTSTPHHPVVVWICVLISFTLLVWLAISSIIQVNNKMKEIDNESII